MPKKPLNKRLKHISYDYPKDGKEHIIHFRQRKKPVNVNADYRFVRGGVFYFVYCSFFKFLAIIVFPVWSFAWMRTKIKGKKNLRLVKKRGVVVIANHVHILDAPVIGSTVGRRRGFRFVMLKENIDLPIAGKILKALGGIPLGQNYGGMKGFTNAITKLLNQNKAVLFFPETALWPYYTQLRPFAVGAFSFATKTNSPVLPFVYTFKTNKKGFKNRLYLNILSPIESDGLTAAELSEKCHAQMQAAMNDFYKALDLGLPS